MKQKVISKIDNEEYKKAVELLMFRPFNMKGQEIEELLYYLLSKGDDWKINLPQKKSAPDMVIIFDNENKKEYEIKFYTGTNRIQFKTSKKDTLDDIRSLVVDFEKNQGKIRKKIISELSEDKEDTMITFTTQNNFIHTYFLNKERIIEIMKESDIEVTWHGVKSKYPRINFSLTKKDNGKTTLTFEAGQNPLNRGFWFEDIKDIEYLTKNEFIHFGISWEKKRTELTWEEKSKFILDKVQKLIDNS